MYWTEGLFFLRCMTADCIQRQQLCCRERHRCRKRFGNLPVADCVKLLKSSTFMPLPLHALQAPALQNINLALAWESEETAAATTSHHNNQQHDRANIRKRNVALGNLVKTPLGMVAGSDHFCWRFSPGAAAFEFFSP